MWWEYAIAVAVALFLIYAFATVVGFQLRMVTRKTHRKAEDMYDDYDDDK